MPPEGGAQPPPLALQPDLLPPPRRPLAPPPGLPRRVYLHGFTQAPEAWEAVRAASGRPAGGDIMVRLPGHASRRLGAHLPAAAARPQDAFVGWVQQLADQLAARSPQPWHLIGYSMGARVALGLACLRPRQLAAATLIGVQPGLAAAAARAGRQAAERAWQGELAGADARPFLRRWARLPLFASQRQLPAACRRRMRRWRGRHPAWGLAACLSICGLGHMPSWWPRLSRLQLPVQFLAGAQDLPYLALAERAAGRCPDGRAAAILGAGHNLPLEQPIALAACLDRFEASLAWGRPPSATTGG